MQGVIPAASAIIAVIHHEYFDRNVVFILYIVCAKLHQNNYIQHVCMPVGV